MSRLVNRSVTLVVDGDDLDVPLRCWVDVCRLGATLDGAPEVLIKGEWVEMDPKLVRFVDDAICEQAVTEEADEQAERSCA